MTPGDPGSWPLPLLMARMDAAGWAYRLSSRLIEGQRLYRAVVWREGQNQSGGLKSRHPVPSRALAEGWRTAQQREKRAPAEYRQRLKNLGLTPEEPE